MNNQLMSPYQRLAIAEGRKERMRFRTREESDFREGWVGEILNADSNQLTPQLAQRVAVVERAVPVKEWRIYHEAPKLLPAPKDERTVAEKLEPTLEPILQVMALIAVAVGAILAFMVRLALFLVFGLDPVVVAVMPDGSLVEVAKWYEPTSP